MGHTFLKPITFTELHPDSQCYKVKKTHLTFYPKLIHMIVWAIKSYQDSGVDLGQFQQNFKRERVKVVKCQQSLFWRNKKQSKEIYGVYAMLHGVYTMSTAVLFPTILICWVTTRVQLGNINKTAVGMESFPIFIVEFQSGRSQAISLHCFQLCVSNLYRGSRPEVKESLWVVGFCDGESIPWVRKGVCKWDCFYIHQLT